jgi:hypothetical protein
MRTSVSVFTLILTAALALVSNGTRAGTDVATGLGGFEPHNAVVNPLNPSQVAVMRGCTVLISNAFGQDGFPVVYGSDQGPACGGDPSLTFDSQGRLFVTHLITNPMQTVVVAQIPDLTTSGTYTTVQVDFNATGDDKQWIAADANPNSPFRDNLYLVWTEFTNPWQIVFSMSTDQGANWSTPQPLSPADDDGDGAIGEDVVDGMDNDGDNLVDEDPPEGDVWPSHLAVAANGDVYVAWHTNTCDSAPTPADEGTTVLVRDGSGGADFANGVVPSAGTPFGPGEATVTCNRQDDPADFSVGDTIADAEFWLPGSMQPWILPDPLFSNRVYVVGNDDPDNMYASGDDGVIVIARSDDFGRTFTVDRVDHGPANSFAVMPTAHIDQDGEIGVTWYTNRRQLMNSGSLANDGDGNFLVDLYGTTSRNGGATFINDFRISDDPFDPDVNKTSNCRYGTWSPPGTTDCTARIGEYNGFWTVDGIGYASWTGNPTPPNPPSTPDGAGGMAAFFDIFSMSGAFPDRLEPNESRDFAVVADLGADNTYNEADLGLHTATDVDFFKIVALNTGKLEVMVQFNEVVMPGLTLNVQDSLGNVVVLPTAPDILQTGSSIHLLAIPAVQGEIYFVSVFDASAPDTTAPQATYDLTVINRPAPTPFEIDLLAGSDSGVDSTDDLTRDSSPSIRLRADVVDAAVTGINILSSAQVAPADGGYAVAIFDDGVFVDYADPVGGTNDTVWQFTLPSLPDGAHSITAKVEVFDPAVNQTSGYGAESNSLLLTIDTSAPAMPLAPDLLPSSDSAGVNIDNITTIMSPAFQGFVEDNALVRIYADAVEVGRGQAGSSGDYEITVEPLADGVYTVTASAEDAAGNLSAASLALEVTIANQSLSLAGAPAPVAVDIANSTVTGFAGIPGGVVGILGIPEVNLDANGNSLQVLGTGGPDFLAYHPTSADGGSIELAGRAQVLNFAGVGGAGFSLDPLAGDDQVAVHGTVNGDTMAAIVDTVMSVHVNGLLPVAMPSDVLERFVLFSEGGTDVVDITVFDSVSANLTVDASAPSTNPKRGDELVVTAGSAKAKILTQPSAVKGSGSVLISYDMTTGAASRIDYAGVERVSKGK